MRTLSTICFVCLITFLLEGTGRAQWVQTNGPFGGGVTCFAVSDANLFAAGMGGLFRSTDEGKNWTSAGWANNITVGYDSKYITTLAVCSGNLFVGTSGVVDHYDRGKVFRSTDNGSSWTTILGDSTVPCITSMLVMDTILFVGTDGGGLFWSSNYGSSWAQITFISNLNPIQHLASSGTTVFAGNSGGLYRSTDFGSSWSAADSGLPATYLVSALAVSSPNVLLGTQSYPFSIRGGLYLSTNNGTNWTRMDSSLIGGVVSLAVSGSRVFAGTEFGEIFRSNDSGITWTQVNVPFTHEFVSALAIYPASSQNLFAGFSEHGIFLTTNNGTSWSEVNNGFVNTDIAALTVIGTNVFAGSRTIGMFLTTDNGSSWSQINNGLTDPTIQRLAVSGTNLFAGTGSGKVFITTNSGVQWSDVSSGLPDNWVSALAVSGANIFAGFPGDGVFLSTNNGINWTAVDNGLTVTAVNTLCVSGPNILAGTEQGVFRSSDNGTSWLAVNNGLPKQYDSSRYIQVRTLTSIGSSVIAGTEGLGIYVSTNAGTDWVSANTGLPNASANSFASYGANLFASLGNSGLFLTTNNGTTWAQVDTGLTLRSPFFAVSSLASTGFHLFAGTGRAGVWHRPLSEMVTSVQSVSGVFPREFCLEQNYPNPFNPSTTISYQLPRLSDVTLKLFDVLGREVATLVSSIEQPGYKSVTFDASKVSSGMYFYRLQAGNYVQTKKLLLLR